MLDFTILHVLQVCQQKKYGQAKKVWRVVQNCVRNLYNMVNTQEETAGKRKRTYWLEDSLITDIDVMEMMTGSDKTKIIHEAVRAYKESDEFKAEVAKHQAAMAAAKKSLNPKTLSKYQEAEILKQSRRKKGASE